MYESPLCPSKMNFIIRKLVWGAKHGNDENECQRQPTQHIIFQFRGDRLCAVRQTERHTGKRTLALQIYNAYLTHHISYAIFQSLSKFYGQCFYIPVYLLALPQNKTLLMVGRTALALSVTFIPFTKGSRLLSHRRS